MILMLFGLKMVNTVKVGDSGLLFLTIVRKDRGEGVQLAFF